MTSTETTMKPRARYGDEGWTFGTTDSGRWLTVFGSHWNAPILHATEAEARTAMEEFAVDRHPETVQRLTVARVQMVFHGGVESGRAFRILTVAACPTCTNGCDCQTGVDQGCGHYACWGISPVETCPRAAIERARYAVRS